MGQAKQRGSKEERRIAAIQRERDVRNERHREIMRRAGFGTCVGPRPEWPRVGNSKDKYENPKA